MKSYDWALLKHGHTKYNFALGEPLFMADIGFLPYSDGYNFSIDHHFEYPPFGGLKELQEQIKTIYGLTGHIVICNGGKQGLLAAMYALREADGYDTVIHPAPYWTSYPSLVQQLNLQFSYDFAYGKAMHIITSPNNPDGSIVDIDSLSNPVDIYDGAYASPIYMEKPIPKNYRMGVFSLSKTIGFTGMRLGWIHTHDEHLAQLAATYIESTTSGVATVVQLQAHCIITDIESEAINDIAYDHDNEISDESDASFFRPLYNSYMVRSIKAGRDHLQSARSLMMNSWGSYISDFGNLATPHPCGMFGWFRVSDAEKWQAALKLADASMVSGEAFGMIEPGWFRASCGLHMHTLKSAIKDIAEAAYKVWNL